MSGSLTPPPWIRRGAALAALGVAAGAFGAHALAANPRLDSWKTAALYHLVHAVALVLPSLPIATRRLHLAGVVVFSGSLYLLVLLDAPWLGAVTPIGGVCFILGWLWAAFGPRGE
jgi:uncharacterized membrane protein YgdD (TMEM256/DUF423 family)